MEININIVLKVEKIKTLAFQFEEVEIDHLFPSLKARVPDEAMPGVMDIVHRIGLKEYDAWEILKKTGGKRLTDQIELRP